jgi:hypothetical protein
MGHADSTKFVLSDFNFSGVSSRTMTSFSFSPPESLAWQVGQKTYSDGRALCGLPVLGQN